MIVSVIVATSVSELPDVATISPVVTLSVRPCLSALRPRGSVLPAPGAGS
jgi:hypothetical protein